MDSPFIVIGGGGHAGVVIDTLRSMDVEIEGVTDPDLSLEPGGLIHGVPYLGDDSVLEEFSPDEVLLANGVASASDTEVHRKIYNRFKEKGYDFPNIVHSTADCRTDLPARSGLQVFASATVQTGVKLGENVIVNTGAVIDHDSQIGDHAHVAPGAVLSGHVALGRGVHVGAGAIIIQEVSVGRNTLVGAGSVVLDDLKSELKVVGQPAREIKQ